MYWNQTYVLYKLLCAWACFISFWFSFSIWDAVFLRNRCRWFLNYPCRTIERTIRSAPSGAPLKRNKPRKFCLIKRFSLFQCIDTVLHVVTVTSVRDSVSTWEMLRFQLHLSIASNEIKMSHPKQSNMFWIHVDVHRCPFLFPSSTNLSCHCRLHRFYFIQNKSPHELCN